MINKIKLRIIIKKLFKKAIIKNKLFYNKINILPAFLSGITIKIGGRLLTHRVVPRKTVKIIQKGSLARRYNDFLTVSNFTAKNRRGIFCYTITIGHKYY